MRRFLFASDSFKGSLASTRIAEILEQEARKAFPNASCSSLPIADGGEGTVDAVLCACGGERVHARVEGPLGDMIDAYYGILPDGRCVIELAAASGITLVDRGSLDPLKTSSRGFGQLIRHALEHGARDIILALGGSATNDGGMGAMRALGVRFLNGRGEELSGRGEDLSALADIDCRGLIPKAHEAVFTVMCDVTNPLIGRKGATAVFGPQKGGTRESLAELERGMVNYSCLLERKLGVSVASMPGAGAAGGMGAAAAAFLSARLVSGIECLMDLAHFDELLEGADCCFSGEGRVDSQSLDGKVLSGVARRCAEAGKPLYVIAGSVGNGAETLLERGATRIIPCVESDTPLEEALAHAEENYRRAASKVFAALLEYGEGEWR
ncbi:MAG: glycerate kinase [Collinsella sp.]|nr:glycerate kinase [Collinsella sp.]